MKKYIANILIKTLMWTVKNSTISMSFVAQKLLTTPTLHGPKERLVILDRVSQANTLFNTRSGSITVQCP